MPYDPELQLRGRLVRALLTLRDMRPGAASGCTRASSRWLPLLLLYQLARSCWQIDAQVFQTLTVDCHFRPACAPSPRACAGRCRLWTPAEAA